MQQLIDPDHSFGLTSLSTLNEGSIFEDSGIKSVYVAWPTPVPAGQFFYGWRKRSIPTHSEWLYPLTFDAGKGLKEA